MNGKDFKAFAQLVPDDAVVEFNHYGWEPLEASKIRACLVPSVAASPAEQTEAAHE